MAKGIWTSFHIHFGKIYNLAATFSCSQLPKSGDFDVTIQYIYVCCAFNSCLRFFLTEHCFHAWSRMNRLSILSSKHRTGLHRGPTSTSTGTFLDGNKSLQPHSNIWWKQRQQQKKHLEEQRHLQHHSDAHCGAKTCFTERFL